MGSGEKLYMNLVIRDVLPTDCSPRKTSLNFLSAAWANSLVWAVEDDGAADEVVAGAAGTGVACVAAGAEEAAEVPVGAGSVDCSAASPEVEVRGG